MNIAAFGGAPDPVDPPTLTVTPIAAVKPAPPRKPKAPKAPKEPDALVESIADLTARLGKSLGVPVETGYDPDLFIKAISTAHATLMGVRKDLGEFQDQLIAREKAVAAREQAVQGREASAKALATLAGLLPAGGASQATQGAFKKMVLRWLGA